MAVMVMMVVRVVRAVRVAVVVMVGVSCHCTRRLSVCACRAMSARLKLKWEQLQTARTKAIRAAFFLHLTADELTYKQVLVANNGTCQP